MFTGIVEEVGVLRAVVPRRETVRLEVAAEAVLADARTGASIAVNGACLTLVDHGRDWWAADVVAETLARTNLGGLAPGDRVNLERPVGVADRFGGHVVLGHIDATITITALCRGGDGAAEMDVALPESLAPLVIEKGSVALDGVSLTVAAVRPGGFSVALIPHTCSVTTFGDRRPGDRLNLEVDYLAKIVARLAAPAVASER
ncbi:MAG TPA: riboflavin synthase [Acidimicrobiales bacterium]|jgi:riboflavin synthase|nr:riboflavin synthase [Acidimicrobiales bacterium]